MARLIKKKYKTDVEFYTIRPKDVPALSQNDVDFLFVSFVGVQGAMAFAKSVKYRKPKPFTVFGGPAMIFPAAFRYMADAIIIGRGEDAIFKVVEGDYTGMMLRDSTLRNDEVSQYLSYQRKKDFWKTRQRTPEFTIWSCGGEDDFYDMIDRNLGLI